MTAQMQHILQRLFSKNSVDEIPVDELKRIVHDHPYFSLGHFLLLEKLRTSEDQLHEDQLRLTGLHFHEPLWLQWLLSNGVEVQEQVQIAPHQPEAQLHQQSAIEMPPPFREEIEINQEEEQAVETLAEENQDKPAEAEFHSSVEPGAEEFVQTESPAEIIGHVQPQEQEETPVPDAVLESDAGLAEAPEVVTIEEQQIEMPAEQSGSIEQEQLQDQSETIHTEQSDELPLQQPVDLVTHVSDEMDHVSTEENKIEPETGNKFSEVPKEQTDDLKFEPYHTIDYFASQGIKISAEIKSDDRLGKQLKSFTEWLKTMKRLPQAQMEQEIDDTSQQNIQRIAEHSLEEKEVITEAMAEVLLKQNRPWEAIKIYEKLSLLDPSKKAYFAAKIEHLKEM